MNEEQVIKLFVDWFYETDAILDEAGLDAFHDKSVVTSQAKKLIDTIKTELHR